MKLLTRNINAVPRHPTVEKLANQMTPPPFSVKLTDNWELEDISFVFAK